MLVEHRINNVDECLVAIEKAVSSGQQITFQPAFTLMLAQHFHDPSRRRQPLIIGLRGGIPLALGHVEQCFKSIRQRLVRAEDAEIPGRHVANRHVAQKRSHDMGVANAARAGNRHVTSVIAKVWHLQIAQQQATIGMWIGTHAALANGCQFGKFRQESTVGIEQLLDAVTLEPFFEQGQMTGFRRRD